MELPKSEHINTAYLNNIYRNTTATYKFYWFLSILNLVIKNKTKFSFFEIIANMIAESWYPIHYFKISFGKSDSLYDYSNTLQTYLNIPIDESKQNISKCIKENIKDKVVLNILKKLTQYVPYRFLTPWIHSENNATVELLSQEFYNDCIYSINGTMVTINPNWLDYLHNNYNIIKDFSLWNLTLFLQKRNPNVPDLSSKLIKPINRESLSQQHKLWDQYIDIKQGIKCIYTGKMLYAEKYDLDHFIPWSFVSHNLMWNLLPVDSSINSSKSNYLPDLKHYLEPMANIHHEALKIIYPLNQNNKLFEDYLTIYDSISELINMTDLEFYELYHKTFSPIAQIAENTGFTYWQHIVL